MRRVTRDSRLPFCLFTVSVFFYLHCRLCNKKEKEEKGDATKQMAGVNERKIDVAKEECAMEGGMIIIR